MKNYRLAIYCFLILTVLGCGSGKKATVERDNPYRRKAITEVSEQALRVDGMIIDSKTQLNNGNVAEAERLFEAVLAQDSANAAAHYELGRIHYQKMWFETAEQHARAAWESDKSNVWYGLLLSEIYKNTGDGKSLVAVWTELVNRYPEKIEYYYELSNAYAASGNIPEAVAALNRVEKMIGVTEDVSLQKQKLWTIAERSDKALKEIEKLAEAMPHEKRYQAILSELYLKQGKRDKARQCYERIAAIDPDDEYVHISLASYYKESGDMNRAYEELKLGFRSPAIDNKSKLQILGSFYTTEEFYGKYHEQAFSLLDQLMAETDDTVTYAAFYGDVLMRQERYPEAARQFRIAIASDSSQYEVWEALLICENMLPNNDDRMMSLAIRASKLFPLHILPYYIQGQTLVNQKRYDEAVTPLEQCVKIGFPNGYLAAGCYSLLGESYYRVGRYDEAWATFDRCLVETSNDITVMNNYAYYLSEQGMKLEEAERMSKTTIDAEPDNATYLDTYAWVLHKMGRNAEALKYMERAIRADKSNSETLRDHYETIKNALK